MPRARPRLSRIDRKERTGRRLRAASLRVCSRHGFLRLKTLDVARAAGVSHGAVFKHFPSRDALLLDTIQLVGRRLTDRLHELGQSGSGLRAALAAYLQCVEENEALYARLVTEVPHLPPQAQRLWIGVQSAVCVHLSRAVEEETRRGTLREMPLHLLFNTWTSLVHHYLAHRELFAPGESVIRRHGDMLLEHFLSLVSKQ